jgi:hypothetical protein
MKIVTQSQPQSMYYRLGDVAGRSASIAFPQARLVSDVYPHSRALMEALKIKKQGDREQFGAGFANGWCDMRHAMPDCPRMPRRAPISDAVPV